MPKYKIILLNILGSVLIQLYAFSPCFLHVMYKHWSSCTVSKFGSHSNVSGRWWQVGRSAGPTPWSRLNCQSNYYTLSWFSFGDIHDPQRMNPTDWSSEFSSSNTGTNDFHNDPLTTLTYSGKYLDMSSLNWHDVWYRHSWFKEDVLLHRVRNQICTRLC